jgi:hypothetical protein
MTANLMDVEGCFQGNDPPIFAPEFPRKLVKHNFLSSTLWVSDSAVRDWSCIPNKFLEVLMLLDNIFITTI